MKTFAKSRVRKGASFFLLFLAAGLIARCSVSYASYIADERVGDLTPILEPSMDDVLEARLKESEKIGLLARKKGETLEAMKTHSDSPAALHLPRAKEERVRQLQIQIKGMEKIPENLQSAIKTLNRQYVFIDGSDRAQVSFLSFLLMRSAGDFRVVLTRGSVKNVLGLLKNDSKVAPSTLPRLYGDQGGTLVKKFGIEALPAIVRINGFAVTVKEVLLPPSMMKEGA